MKKSTATNKIPSTKTDASSKRGSGVRAFLQANRNRVQKPRSSALFFDEPVTADLSAAAVKQARKSGSLNLSGRGLNTVPPKVWAINELDENEKSAVSVSLDNPSEEKWWEFVDLQKLILANNSIRSIPSDVGRLLSLQTLDAHDNVIETVAEEISNLEYMHKLNLSHNKICFLPNGLYKLKRLSELRLNHNQIEEISKDVGYLSCLQNLDASNNKISSLPDEIGFLSFLTNLNLSSNNLTELPNDFSSLTALRSLDVSENKLARMPKNFSDLVHLEVVYLQKNRLKAIPDLSKCGELREVFLQNNLINYFDSQMFAMTKIQLLDFRCNKIDHLKIQKEHLEFVDRFYLDNNDIAELPDELAMLSSLKSLTLDGNPLRGIRVDILQRGTGELLKYLRAKLAVPVNDRGESPASVSRLDSHRSILSSASSTSSSRTNAQSTPGSALPSPASSALDFHKLKSTRLLNLTARNLGTIEDEIFETAGKAEVNIVDLTKNHLTLVPPSITLVGEYLNELKLDGNRLTSIPSSLGDFKRLQYLSLQGNLLFELPGEFSQLQNLRELNISFNRFQEIPSCLYGLEKLEIINIADNKVVALEPENLAMMKRLSVLDVRNNNIAQLPPEMGLMNQLRSFLVEGNAFRVPGYHIVSQGTPALLNYLRNRIEVKP